jgi:hypothetical protein
MLILVKISDVLLCLNYAEKFTVLFTQFLGQWWHFKITENDAGRPHHPIIGGSINSTTVCFSG